MAEISRRHCHRKATCGDEDSVTPDRPRAQSENEMHEKNHALLTLLPRSVLYIIRLKTIPLRLNIRLDILKRFILLGIV